jgi:type I restriction enzyme S subunit
VHWFRFDLTELKEMLFEDSEVDEFYLKSGDVLICEGGHGIARTAVWEAQVEGMTFQKALHRVRPGKLLNSHFLSFCLRAYESSGILNKYYTGAGIPHFTGRSLAKVSLPLPPIEEQKRIVAKVDRLLARCDRVAAGLRDRQTTTEQLLTASIHRILDAGETNGS